MYVYSDSIVLMNFCGKVVGHACRENKETLKLVAIGALGLSAIQILRELYDFNRRRQPGETKKITFNSGSQITFKWDGFTIDEDFIKNVHESISSNEETHKYGTNEFELVKYKGKIYVADVWDKDTRIKIGSGLTSRVYNVPVLRIIQNKESSEIQVKITEKAWKRSKTPDGSLRIERGFQNLRSIYALAKNPKRIKGIQALDKDGLMKLYSLTLFQAWETKQFVFSNEIVQSRINCLGQIVEGVSFLHANHIAHGDLNDSNVLIVNEKKKEANQYRMDIIDFDKIFYRDKILEELTHILQRFMTKEIQFSQLYNETMQLLDTHFTQEYLPLKERKQKFELISKWCESCKTDPVFTNDTDIKKNVEDIVKSLYEITRKGDVFALGRLCYETIISDFKTELTEGKDNEEYEQGLRAKLGGCPKEIGDMIVSMLNTDPDKRPTMDQVRKVFAS